MKRSKYERSPESRAGWKSLAAFWIPVLTVIVSAYVGFILWLA